MILFSLAAIIGIPLFLTTGIKLMVDCNSKLYTKEKARKDLKFMKWFSVVLTVFFLIVINIVGVTQWKHPSGYYESDTGVYYHIGGTWYNYDYDSGGWNETTADYGRDNYVGDTWNTDWGDTAYSFTNSEAYSDYQDSHSSDSGSSYDSWDSGGTDWGSDW